MINWTNIKDTLPPVDTTDVFNKVNEVSALVLVAFFSISTGAKAIAFANYYYKINYWSIQGYSSSNFKIVCWSEINMPNTPEFLNYNTDPTSTEKFDGDFIIE